VLIVDTGPLVATTDRADKDHLACRALLEGEPGPLVTTAMLIAEAAYLIDRQLGPGRGGRPRHGDHRRALGGRRPDRR